MRLGWNVVESRCAAGEDRPYEYLLEWAGDGEPVLPGPRVGETVVLAQLPPWSGKLRPESRRVLEHCVGRAYPVTEIDDNGLCVLDVSADIDARFGGELNEIRVEIEFLKGEDSG